MKNNKKLKTKFTDVFNCKQVLTWRSIKFVDFCLFRLLNGNDNDNLLSSNYDQINKQRIPFIMQSIQIKIALSYIVAHIKA